MHSAEGLPPLDHQPPGQQDGVGDDHDGEHQEGDVDDDVEVETELHGGCNNVWTLNLILNNLTLSATVPCAVVSKYLKQMKRKSIKIFSILLVSSAAVVAWLSTDQPG